MARPHGPRTVARRSRPFLYRPEGAGRRADAVVVSLDELEAIRLADLEGLYHEAAAIRMGVSRATFGRIAESARRKVADALVNRRCLRVQQGPAEIHEEEERIMKIAVPTRNGQVDAHFGHCEQFTVYAAAADHTIDAGEQLKAPAGCGCKSDIAAIMARMGVTHLVAGGMGEGAVHVMKAHGIEVVRGAAGSAREAAAAFAAGTLVDNGVACASHEHQGHGHGHGHGNGHGHGGNPGASL